MSLPPETSAPQERGFVTLAARSRMYLEMAVDMALSLRHQGEPPVSLVTDRRLLRISERLYAGVFDHIIPLPTEFDRGRALRYAIGEVTPYRRTMVIDSDILAVGPLAESWNRLEGTRFAMMGVWLPADSDAVHHGRPIRVWARELGLSRYFKPHGAVFYFEGRPSEELRAAHKAYRERVWTLRHWTGDENGFAAVAPDIDLTIFPKPWPVLWNSEFPNWDPDRSRAPLFHATGAPPQATVERLVRDVNQRRRNLGLPLTSEPFWRLKMESSNAGKMRSWLRPVRGRLLEWRLAARMWGYKPNILPETLP